MRINGFDQIKAFYTLVFQQEYEFTPQHISLYVFLINQNNRNNWVEWFKCPFDLGMAGSCIGNKKTYYRCLNDLSEWGLLQYEKGSNNWKAPKIRLEVLKSTATETATVPQSEPLPLQVGVPLGEQVSTPLPTHIYKPITSNHKPITELFDRFWEMYDKKRGLKKCKDKFQKLSSDEINEIFHTLPDYIKSTPDKKFRKDPLTYLNGQHWNDEITEAVKSPKPSFPR